MLATSIPRILAPAKRNLASAKEKLPTSRRKLATSWRNHKLKKEQAITIVETKGKNQLFLWKKGDNSNLNQLLSVTVSYISTKLKSKGITF